MPSTFDAVYGVRTLAEYLERVKGEVRRVEELQNVPLPADREHEVISAATHAAATLWHLTDFAYSAPDPEAAHLRAKLGGTTLAEFQEKVRAGRPAITLCWELTNRGKHFNKKPHARVEETTVSAVAAVSIAMLWRPSLRRRRPKLVLPDGRRLRAAEVYGDALAEWEALLGSPPLGRRSSTKAR